MRREIVGTLADKGGDGLTRSRATRSVSLHCEPSRLPDSEEVWRGDENRFRAHPAPMTWSRRRPRRIRIIGSQMPRWRDFRARRDGSRSKSRWKFAWRPPLHAHDAHARAMTRNSRPGFFRRRLHRTTRPNSARFAACVDARARRTPTPSTSSSTSRRRTARAPQAQLRDLARAAAYAARPASSRFDAAIAPLTRIRHTSRLRFCSRCPRRNSAPAQRVFAATGGLHGARITSRSTVRRCSAMREDVGTS